MVERNSTTCDISYHVDRTFIGYFSKFKETPLWLLRFVELNTYAKQRSLIVESLCTILK